MTVQPTLYDSHSTVVDFRLAPTAAPADPASTRLAPITCDPATESVNVVVTSAIGGSGGPSIGACHDLNAAGVATVAR